MAFVPVPNAAKIELIYTSQGQRVENVFHVQQSTPYDETSLNLMAALFKDWWDDSLRPWQPDDIQLVMIRATALDSQAAPGIEFTAGLPLSGGDTTGVPLPNNVTVVVKWQTGLRGRSFRGRTYHIGLSQGQVSGSTVSGGVITALSAAYADLIDAVEGLSAELGIVSTVSNNAPRTTGVFTQVTGLSINSTTDSQRRRLPERGA